MLRPCVPITMKSMPCSAAYSRIAFAGLMDRTTASTVFGGASGAAGDERTQSRARILIQVHQHTRMFGPVQRRHGAHGHHIDNGMQHVQPGVERARQVDAVAQCDLRRRTEVSRHQNLRGCLIRHLPAKPDGRARLVPRIGPRWHLICNRTNTTTQQAVQRNDTAGAGESTWPDTEERRNRRWSGRCASASAARFAAEVPANVSPAANRRSRLDCPRHAARAAKCRVAGAPKPKRHAGRAGSGMPHLGRDLHRAAPRQPLARARPLH